MPTSQVRLFPDFNISAQRCKHVLTSKKYRNHRNHRNKGKMKEENSGMKTHEMDTNVCLERRNQ
jgi:hypothetical protein